MTRDEARGQQALGKLANYVEPQLVFVPSGDQTKRLYKLEGQRAETIKACAREWLRLTGLGEDKYWTQAIPQQLHDTLDGYETACGIIAAEAFLKRHGWKVERPAA